MPEIRQTLSFLTISNRILERNFTYKVINSMNSLFKVAHVTIKKNYFLANQIPVAKGDTISLSLQNNNEDKVTIFSGVIFDISTTNSEIQLKAEFRIVDNTIFNETYQDCTLEYALQKLLPSDKLKYEAQEVKGDQFILDGTKERSLKTQLKNHSYCLDLNNSLVVLDKSKRGEKYIIDNCIKDIRGNQITIFPIPQLDLLDTVEYSNGIGELKKQKYLVRGLRVVGDYINMILDVAPYQEEIVKQNPPQEEAPLPASKPVKELFAPSITQAGRGETADSLLEQLSDKAETHIRKIAEDVRVEMGDSFETIIITSAYRDHEYQRDRVFLKKIKLKGTSSMYEYYKIKAPASAPYLKIIQYLYDGIYSHKDGGTNHESYLADLYGINNEQKRMVFQKIIEGKVYEKYDFDSYKKNEDAIKELLTQSYVNPPILLYNPSFHVIDDSLGNPNSFAVDLRKSDASYKLSKKYREEKKGDYYDGSTDGEPHYHLTYEP